MFFKKQKPSSAEARPRRNIVQRRSDQPTPPPQGRGQVFSYHASRSQRQEVFDRVTPNKAERIKQWQERLRWLRSAPRVIMLAFVLIIIGLLLRLDPHATVIPLEEAQGQVFLRSLKTYEDAVHSTFARSFVNGNKVTVSASRISADLRQQFPELKTVAISLPLVGSRPVVYIQPAVPALILTTKRSGVMVVDTSGKALITGNQVPDLDKLKLPVVHDESNLAFRAGSIALPAQSVAFITEVVGQLKAKSIPISSLTLPVEASELQVRIEGKPYFVKFNLHGQAREEAGAFIAVKARLESEHKTPATYIDVRVPNRAYFK
jgi:hypothetical protein